MGKINYTDRSRRQFIGTTASLVTGLTLAPQLISVPNILHFYNKPNSIIKGVQIGTITYSFRSMPDQSAEATLKYILDAGISAVELMGEPAESFAGAPQSTIDRRVLFPLMRRKRNNEAMTEGTNQAIGRAERTGRSL